MGLASDDREALREAVTALAVAGRRRGAHPVRPGLIVTVDAHGSDGQPLRDGAARLAARRSLNRLAGLGRDRPSR
jgi:hypothetical protein